jgi:ribonuclease P protein component
LEERHGNAVAAPERLRQRADFLRAAKGMHFYARGLTLQAAPRPIPSETMDLPAPGDPTTFCGVTRTDQIRNPLDVVPWMAAPRFGFTVTKQSGGAVKRNRIRRRLKEAVRLLDPLPALPGHDYVILARPEALGMPFPVLQGELIHALGNIHARKPRPSDNDREGRAAGDANEALRQSSKGRISKE